MVPRRDLADFEERAHDYDSGWRGRLHHEISERTARLARSMVPAPTHVLDVGSGTGYVLRLIAGSAPAAATLSGIDPAPSMVAVARRLTPDMRIDFQQGVAESLPFRDTSFDLVVSTTSFDHWSNQLRGLQEIARVMRPGAALVLVDQFSNWLLPTLIIRRRGKARTRRRATRLITDAGLEEIRWHAIYASIIKAVTARASLS